MASKVAFMQLFIVRLSAWCCVDLFICKLDYNHRKCSSHSGSTAADSVHLL